MIEVRLELELELELAGDGVIRVKGGSPKRGEVSEGREEEVVWEWVGG